MTFSGAPMMAGGEPPGDLQLTEKAGGEELSARDEEAVQWRVALASWRSITLARIRT